ncbi:NTP transferase domain-containing protein [Salinilacihabitans rarus]|uniref:NTP transferase domain-containing protein n=1 Tax=Salinilacihabitans rarus TaxID=2961596 RepID=UPI0020C874B3|nr:NTP transferase domain-containing protein [Salinilacihabitans rarus]
MCGGRGTRLESAREKPLHPVAGVPMVDRVRRALAASAVETVRAVVSPNAPETRAHLEAAGVRTVETPGEGYVTDLGVALDAPGVETPALTVAADLPLLDGPAVDAVLARHRGDASLAACVPTALKRRLGAGGETTLDDAPHLAPTGVNVVGGSDRRMTHTSYDPRLAINVNRLEDARVAAALLERDGPETRGEDPCE